MAELLSHDLLIMIASVPAMARLTCIFSPRIIRLTVYTSGPAPFSGTF